MARGLVPDGAVRVGSRYGARARERREASGGVAEQSARLEALVERMSTGPIAELPEPPHQPNDALPLELLGLVLGPRRKDSGCLWSEGVRDLAGAEEAMLRLTCKRARVADGMRILDLGCGWGSLSLWLAERLPRAQITGVSSSARHREWIEARRDELGLRNLRVLTADIDEFTPPTHYHRILSVETFERMRNWRELLRRLRTWCRPDGLAFVHVFSHRTLPYRLEGTWAAERCFTPGLMPSHDLLLHFAEHMRVVESWMVPGTHYAHTLDAWLANLDTDADAAMAVLEADGRSRAEARRLLAGWRLCLISQRALWRYRRGNRWLVSQYLLEPRRPARA